jgi:hypothetical protein
MLRKEKVHCYSLFLDRTYAQSCINGAEELLECLKLEVIEDLTEVFLTELPKKLQKRFREPPIDSPNFESDEVEKSAHKPPKVTFARVRLHGLLLCLLPPRRMENYGFCLPGHFF